MQVYTDQRTVRAQPRPMLNTNSSPPLARSRPMGLRPEPDGLSAAELRRIVADLLG